MEVLKRMKCKNCKQDMIRFRTMLGNTEEIHCENLKCKFYGRTFRISISEKELGDRGFER